MTWPFQEKWDHSEFMVLALHPSDEFRKSILGDVRGKALASVPIARVSSHSRAQVIFCVAGCRPGRRACCLTRPEWRNRCCGAKGPKTIDAPPGLIEADGRQPEESGPTRGACPESCRRALTRSASA
jgi:hypothetical protein